MTPYESMMYNIWLPRIRSAAKYVRIHDPPTRSTHPPTPARPVPPQPPNPPIPPPQPRPRFDPIPFSFACASRAVRCDVSNDWNPREPDAMVALLESWSDLLPPFLVHNMEEQLILPKLQREVRTAQRPTCRHDRIMTRSDLPDFHLAVAGRCLGSAPRPAAHPPMAASVAATARYVHARALVSVARPF